MVPGTDYRPILTAARMREHEERAVAAGTSVQELMERAGAGIAEAAHRFGMGQPVLVLCGPGNNGGDGYVAARILREMGVVVRVCALSEPRSEAAIEAHGRWNGPVEPFPGPHPDDEFYSPVVIDALFGTGRARPLEHEVLEVVRAAINMARFTIAVDLPSGLAADDGGKLGDFRTDGFDLTLALGALKPAHVLYPAAEECGPVRTIDIGLDLDLSFPRENVSPDETIARPLLAEPYHWAHKYTRQTAVVIGGAMPGASALTAEAALRAGAGYCLLLNDAEAACPHAVVQKRWSPEAWAETIANRRWGVVVVGPGLGRDTAAKAKLEAAIACGLPLIVDGDALHMLTEEHFAIFRERTARVVLTPHEGEFAGLFGAWSGSKIEAARSAAIRSGASVVFKGAGTVVAHPNGWTNTALHSVPWLSTAGTGDVLAGVIAGTFDPVPLGDDVEAAVWIHAEAARRLGGAFIADDLLRAISEVRGSL